MSPLEQQIKHKIEAVGTPLEKWDIRIYRGVLTGLNEAFIINSATKDTLIAADPRSAEIIRPILRGRDIKRYAYDFADLWIIFTQTGDASTPAVEIENYPAIKEHLDKYYLKLETRQDQGITPYHLRRCAYTDDFSKQKIAWGNLSLDAQYTWVSDDFIINNPSNFIVSADKYLLGILNSKLADFYIRSLGVTRNGGYFEYKPMFVEKLPVPQIDSAKRKPYIELVDRILTLKSNGESSIQEEIELEALVFSLYGLTDDEAEYIKCGSSLQ